MFQSIVRIGRVPKVGTDGNLMRARPDGSEKIDVDFMGTDPRDPTTGIV